MIEEIKKEINENKISVSKNNYCMIDIYKCDYVIDYNKILEILNKYNNQPDYKSAWEELKTNEMAVDKISLDIMQELEQKYNLGGE